MINEAKSSTTIIPEFNPLLKDNEPFEEKDPRLLFWHQKRREFETTIDDGEEYAKYVNLSNGLITEFNPTLTNAMACNTCVSMLGSTREAKAAVYYMSKYMTKDPVASAFLYAILNSLIA